MSASGGPGFLLLGAMTGALVAARFETAGLCLAVALIPFGGGGFRRPARSWLIGITTAAAVAVALNLYLTPGTALPGPRLLGVSPSREGLRIGALLALRLVAAAAAIQGLRRVWPGERAADELARLAAPLERLRVPVREARAMIGLSLRFAPLLVDETRRIARIQDARAGAAPRGLRERLTRRRAALIPALVAALERAERTALALEARHYRLRPVPRAASGHPGWTLAALTLAGTALVWRGS